MPDEARRIAANIAKLAGAEAARFARASWFRSWRALLNSYVNEKVHPSCYASLCVAANRMIMAGPITPPLTSKWSV